MTLLVDGKRSVDEAALQENGLSPVAEAAINRRQRAAELRAWSNHMKDMSPEVAHLQADRLDAEANMLSHATANATPPAVVGAGGEIAPDASKSGNCFADTMQGCPSAVAVDASRHRLSLVKGVGAGALALDAAESVQAANSLEKMVAHQIAASHAVALQVLSEGHALINDFQKTGRRHAALTVEAARLLNVAGRLMESTQRGVMTLHRLRHSGQQQVVVQHVHVGEGGQAVVAGQMKSRGQRRQTSRGEDEK